MVFQEYNTVSQEIPLEPRVTYLPFKTNTAYTRVMNNEAEGRPNENHEGSPETEQSVHPNEPLVSNEPLEENPLVKDAHYYLEHPDEAPSPEEVINILKDQVGVSMGEEDVAKRVLREGLVPAAVTVVHLAQFGNSERIKLEASKIVIERNMGKGGGELSDTWEKLFQELQKNP